MSKMATIAVLPLEKKSKGRRTRERNPDLREVPELGEFVQAQNREAAGLLVPQETVLVASA